MKHEPRQRTGALAAWKVGEDGNDLFSLLRYAHIFSAVVREVLEEKLLEDVSPAALTLPQFHLLKVMSFNGRHQIGDVAQFLGVTPPAATRNVDKLEGLGLIVRSPAENDRRATLISVSEKGMRLVHRCEELKRVRLLPVLEQFSPDELDQLADLLERFSVSVLESGHVQGGPCLRCASYVESRCAIGRARGGCPYEELSHDVPKGHKGSAS